MSDIMLLGVLRMPVNFQFTDNSDELVWMQVKSRMIEAADRIESNEKDLTALRAENDRLKEDKRELVEALNDTILAYQYGRNYFSCQKIWPEKGRCLCNGCVTTRSKIAVAKHHDCTP